MNIKEMIKIIREIQKKNPYPSKVFIEPTQYAKFNAFLEEKDLYPGAYNDSVSRKVWNICCDKIIERLKECDIK